MIYITADLHFDDDNIRRMEREEFKDVTEMNEIMVKNWNSKVTDNDIVYVLGDFGNTKWLDKLNGDKILIVGDHDNVCGNWTKVYDKPIIVDDYWILSHRPMYVNNKMPYANIFGHVHGNKMYTDYGSNHFCACIERTGYELLTFTEIKEKVYGSNVSRVL